MKLNKAPFYIALSLMLVIALAATLSCSPTGQPDHGPQITSLTAEHAVVYPLGNTRIDCIAMNQDGNTLNYTWACSDGKIFGSGQQITWEAPRSYGDFHIMATVDDGKGNSANKAVTVTVIVRDPSTCCK